MNLKTVKMMILIPVILFLVGLILGIVLTYYFLKGRSKAWFKEWKTEYEEKIRKDVLKRSRASLKGRVGEQMAPLFPVFDHEPADARFIGSPVDYVIFEGHSEEEPEGVTFADIKTGKTARLTPLQKGFKKAIQDGKVNWETIHLGEVLDEEE